MKARNIESGNKKIPDEEYSVWDDDSLENGEVFDALEFFNENQYNREYIDEHAELLNKYYDNPTAFLNVENIEELNGLGSGGRVIFLSRIAQTITATPEMAKQYFNNFPDDLKVVRDIAVERQGTPSTNAEYSLFSLCALELSDQYPQLIDNFSAFDQFIEIAARKNVAPDFILGDEIPYYERFKSFGNAADGMKRALIEASELNMSGEYIIDANQIFTPEYEALSPEQQAEFLRNCVNQIQYNLVFQETYNSAFTAEKEDKKRSEKKEWKNEYGYNFITSTPAHSMLFKTFQPRSAYELGESIYVDEMNSSASIGGDIEEYPYHRLLLGVLKRLKTAETDKGKTTDLVVDFWSKNRNPIFGNAVADIISSQDPNRGASKLLETIRAEKVDKTPLTSILYRLEFNRIGISKEGVKYLEKIYDLGELNNPEYHVSRLTADGDIGIFDEDLKLIKYFLLGDLSSEDKKVEAKVMDFVYETLFLAGSDETPEQKNERLRYLEEFKLNYYKIAQDKIFEDTGAKLNNLSFREQGWFVIYFNQASGQEKDRLRNFVGIHGELGIKTFLSLEQGIEMGDKIMELGELLPEEIAEKIFKKYNEISTMADRTIEEIDRILGLENKLTAEQQKLIKENILKRGKDLLYEFSNLARRRENDEDIRRIVKHLDAIKSDIILFGSTFKALSESGDKVELNDFSFSRMETKKPADLSPTEKEEMVRMFLDNRESGYSQKLLRTVFDDFEQSINPEEGTPKAQSDFIVLKYNNNIVSFMRLEPRGSGHLYAAAFNTRPEAKGFKIGNAMMQEIIDNVSKKNIVEAIAYSAKPALLEFYKSKFGFQEVGETEIAGEKFIKLERNDGVDQAGKVPEAA